MLPPLTTNIHKHRKQIFLLLETNIHKDQEPIFQPFKTNIHKHHEETFRPLTVNIPKHINERIFPPLKKSIQKHHGFKVKSLPNVGLVKLAHRHYHPPFNTTAAPANDVSTVGPFP